MKNKDKEKVCLRNVCVSVRESVCVCERERERENEWERVCDC